MTLGFFSRVKEYQEMLAWPYGAVVVNDVGK